MLTAHIDEERNELCFTGTVQIGDLYPNGCCVGYTLYVIDVVPATDPADVSIWGVCGNPDHHCQDHQVATDECPYCNVVNMSAENLALNLAEASHAHTPTA